MHIHIIGICGTFMAGLARLACQLGLKVSGSDANMYPPMSDQLADLGCKLYEGYSESHLKRHPDMVIVGNAVSRGHPEVEAVLRERIPFTSGPAWLHDIILRNRNVIAVAGTHGKTTTSSMLAWILRDNGIDCGFLIGGIPENFGVSADCGSNEWFVIEADEYDTAFFDKRAKFVHYFPKVAVLNNLEFDHADIYPDLSAIEKQFHHLVRLVPDNGDVIVNANSDALDRVLRQGMWSHLSFFGANEWGVELTQPDASQFNILRQQKTIAECNWELFGEHNAMNALAAIVAASKCGVSPQDAATSLESFLSVKRRLQKHSVGGYTLFEDFAHHPTAIAKTLEAMRAHVGGFLAIIDFASNSMRMGTYKNALIQMLESAGEVWIHQAGKPQSDIQALAEATGVKVFHSVEDIVTAFNALPVRPKNTVLMSNKNFGGLREQLLQEIRRSA